MNNKKIKWYVFLSFTICIVLVLFKMLPHNMRAASESSGWTKIAPEKEEYYVGETVTFSTNGQIYNMEKPPIPTTEVVFAVDTTGSMNSTINSAVNNISTFASNLETKNIHPNYSLIQFGDITCNEPTTLCCTKADVNTLKNALTNIKRVGGGDAPESSIDALAMATTLDFDSPSNKFFILVTDAPYKETNNYGYTYSTLIDYLEKNNIKVIVITSATSYYQEMISRTKGFYCNINSAFSTDLMKISDFIAENTEPLDVGDFVLENNISKHLYEPVVHLIGMNSISAVEEFSGNLNATVEFIYNDETKVVKDVSVLPEGLDVSDSANKDKQISKIIITYKTIDEVGQMKPQNFITYSYKTKKPLSNYQEGKTGEEKFVVTNSISYKIKIGTTTIIAKNAASANIVEEKCTFTLNGTVDNKNAITEPPSCDTEFLITGDSYGGKNISKYIEVKNGKSSEITLPYGEYILSESNAFTQGYDLIPSMILKIDNNQIIINESTTINDGGIINFVKPIQVAKINIGRTYKSKANIPLDCNNDFKIRLSGTPVIKNINVDFELTSSGNDEYSKYCLDSSSELIVPIGNYVLKETDSYKLVSLESVTSNDNESVFWHRLLNTNETYKNGKTIIPAQNNQSYSILFNYIRDESVYDEYVYENSVYFDISFINNSGQIINDNNIKAVSFNPYEHKYPITLTHASNNNKYCGLIKPDKGILFKYMSPGKYYITCFNNMQLNYQKLQEINSNIEFGEENGIPYLIIPDESAHANYNEISELKPWRGYSSFSSKSFDIQNEVSSHVSLTLKAVDQEGTVLSNYKFQFYSNGKPVYFINKNNKWYPSQNKENAISVFETNKDGEVYIYKFPEGEYTIEALSLPETIYNPMHNKSINIDGTCNVEVNMTMVDKNKLISPISINIESVKTNIDINERISIASKIVPSIACKDVVYASSNPEIATISDDGTVEGKKIGTTNISVISALDNSLIKELEFTVYDSNNPNIQDIRQTTSIVKLNVGEDYKANIAYSPIKSNNNNIMWSSQNPEIAEVSEDGLILGKSDGITNVIATCGDLTSTCQVIVGQVNIKGYSINIKNKNIQLFCNNKDLSEGKVDVNIATKDNSIAPTIYFTSSNPDIVSVDHDGNLKAITAGEVTITAYTINGLSTTCNVTSKTIVDTISLSTYSFSIAKGAQANVIATAFPNSSINKDNLKWESLNPDVVSVNNGVVTAKDTGRTTIIVSASFDGTEDIIAECYVQVLPYDASMVLELALDESFSSTTIDDAIEFEVGQSSNFWARISPEPANVPDIVWELSRNDIIEIVPADAQKNTNEYIIKTINSDSCGEVTVVGKIEGTSITNTFTVIVYSPGTGVSISTNSNSPLIVGKSPYDEITARLEYDNPFSFAKNIQWELSDESIATIDYINPFNKEKIIVKAKKEGEVTLTVTATFRFGGTYSNSIAIKSELPKLSVSLEDGTNISNLSLNNGDSTSILVNSNYPKDDTIFEVISTNNNVQIELLNDEIENGSKFKVTGLAPGEDTITISSSDDVLSPVTIDVIISGVVIDSKNKDDGSIQLNLKAIGNSTLPRTENIQWSSSDESIALIDNNGLIIPVSSGEATFTATFEESSCEITLTIKAVEFSIIESTNDNGDVQLLFCLNGSPYSLPVIWTSKDESIATIDENGIITGVSSGDVTFEANFKTIRVEKTITL